MTTMDDQIYGKSVEALVAAAVARDAAWGRYRSLLDRCYLDPEAAAGRLEAFRATHGRAALLERLSAPQPDVGFGRRPGSILADGLFTGDAAQLRADSAEARRDLPDVLTRYFEANEAFYAALAARDAAAERLPAWRRRDIERAEAVGQSPEPERSAPQSADREDPFDWSAQFAGRGTTEPDREGDTPEQRREGSSRGRGR